MTQTAIVTGVAGVVLGGIVGYFVRRLLDARQIRYRHLYERRAEVISTLYRQLVEVGIALRLWGRPFGGYQEEQKEAFERHYKELLYYFETNSLWLDNKTRLALVAFLEEAREVHRLITDLEEFRLIEEWNEYQSGSKTPMTKAEARSKVLRIATDETPKLEEQLREDFREIIEISDLRDRDAPPSWGRRVWRRVSSFPRRRFRRFRRTQQPEDDETTSG